MKQLTIATQSTNAIKTGAIRVAADRLAAMGHEAFLDAIVWGVELSPEDLQKLLLHPDDYVQVNPYPRGFAEMSLGAIARASAPCLLGYKADLYVGIENGLDENGPSFNFDKALVCAYACMETGGTLAESLGIPVPAEMVEWVRDVGFDKTTLGLEVQKRHPEVNHQDMQAFLSGGIVTRLGSLVPPLMVVMLKEYQKLVAG